MVTARRQLIPWRAAGTRAEMRRNADEVVRDTGWVFNNQTGATLTLEEFVQTGDAEVDVYLDRLGWNSFASGATMLEIGSGIGRMTSAFSRKFAVTVATDVDAAFLERCRETVSRFGRVGGWQRPAFQPAARPPHGLARQSSAPRPAHCHGLDGP